MTITTATDPTAAEPARSVLESMKRGVVGKCPACGKGSLYTRYLKVADRCIACAEDLNHPTANDQPP